MAPLVGSGGGAVGGEGSLLVTSHNIITEPWWETANPSNSVTRKGVSSEMSSQVH